MQHMFLQDRKLLVLMKVIVMAEASSNLLLLLAVNA